MRATKGGLVRSSRLSGSTLVQNEPSRTCWIKTITIACWVRLHIGELPILWNSSGQEYNPDLIAIETDGTHWVVEVKMEKEMGSEDVRGKREAALRWANYVTADEQVGVRWRYLPGL